MKKENSNKIVLPPIVIDKELERFKDKDLFPEKLARTKEIIAKHGLPKTKKQRELEN